MSTIRITVPFDPSLFSLNERLHWRARYQRNKPLKELTRACWLAAGAPRATGRVRVSMIIRRGREIDDDNAITGTKVARDALFNDAITPDDSRKWVRLGEVDQQAGKAWKERPEVEFIIEELSPQPPAGAGEHER